MRGEQGFYSSNQATQEYDLGGVSSQEQITDELWQQVTTELKSHGLERISEEDARKALQEIQDNPQVYLMHVSLLASRGFTIATLILVLSLFFANDGHAKAQSNIDGDVYPEFTEVLGMSDTSLQQLINGDYSGFEQLSTDDTATGEVILEVEDLIRGVNLSISSDSEEMFFRLDFTDSGLSYLATKQSTIPSGRNIVSARMMKLDNNDTNYLVVQLDNGDQVAYMLPYMDVDPMVNHQTFSKLASTLMPWNPIPALQRLSGYPGEYWLEYETGNYHLIYLEAGQLEVMGMNRANVQAVFESAYGGIGNLFYDTSNGEVFVLRTDPENNTNLVIEVIYTFDAKDIPQSLTLDEQGALVADDEITVTLSGTGIDNIRAK